MAYFANGSEAEIFQEHFCGHCQNMVDKNDGRGPGCPIMDLHWLWNYEAIGEKADPTKKAALEHFIPTGKPGEFKECQMFLPVAGYEHMGAAQRNLDKQKLQEWEKVYGKTGQAGA